MKERPIIFSAEMVQAILDGRKTQTRRVMKPQPEMITPGADTQHYPGYPWVKCPYGAPGDRLWVREKWHKGYILKDGVIPTRWRSPIHMPRWASRITLEIISVRVERLQEISEEDCIAEGARLWIPKSENLKQYCDGSYRNGYHELWDSLNEKRGYPWSSNPFVWVIEFKRLESDA